jgi:hypothetical protein
MANTEKLKFSISLFGEYWDKPPVATIKINDKIFISKEIIGKRDTPEELTFTAELEEGKEYSLIIERSGKDDSQCKVDENNKIIKDQLLHIKDIIIDEIDVGGLIYTGDYEPLYPEPWYSQQKKAGINLAPKFKNVTIMGHNGTWTLKFTSPYYMWLLENLY